MIKKAFFIILFFAISPSLIAMEKKLIKDHNLIQMHLDDARTVVFVTDEIAAAGSDRGCFLIHNPTKTLDRSIEYLHSISTHNLISDKKNRIGALCSERFIVYDVTSKENVWSVPIYNDNNYSAAFSKIDDEIFICQNGQLTSNKRKTIQLAHVSRTLNGNLNISCHPKENRILYIVSNNAVATRSLDNPQTFRHYIDIDINTEPEDYIYQAFYSPDGNSVVVQTINQKLYRYFPSSDKTMPININYYNCNCRIIYRTPQFVPKTNDILTFLDNKGILYYGNIEKNEKIGYIQLPTLTALSKFLKTNILDFSPSGIHFITSLKGIYSRESGLIYLSHIMYACWALKNYHIHNAFDLNLSHVIIKLLSTVLKKKRYRIHID